MDKEEARREREKEVTGHLVSDHYCSGTWWTVNRVKKIPKLKKETSSKC